MSEANYGTTRRQAARPRQSDSRKRMVIGVSIAAAALITGGLFLFATGPSPTAVTTPSMPTSTIEPTVTPVSQPATEPSETPALPYEGPTTIGTSVNGTPLEAYRFSEGEWKLLVVGGVHGDEYGAAFTEDFLVALQGDPSLVPEGTEIHVIPDLNPDGRDLDSRGNANRVDINRNMPANTWVAKLDERDSSAKRGFLSGSAPGSEPESQAFIKYMENEFDVVISIHSQGGIIDWDGPGEDLARKMAAVAGAPAQHLGYAPYITGSMGQWVPEAYNIPIITVELNSPELTDAWLNAVLLAAEDWH